MSKEVIALIGSLWLAALMVSCNSTNEPEICHGGCLCFRTAFRSIIARWARCAPRTAAWVSRMCRPFARRAVVQSCPSARETAIVRAACMGAASPLAGPLATTIAPTMSAPAIRTAPATCPAPADRRAPTRGPTPARPRATVGSTRIAGRPASAHRAWSTECVSARARASATRPPLRAPLAMGIAVTATFATRPTTTVSMTAIAAAVFAPLI